MLRPLRAVFLIGSAFAFGLPAARADLAIDSWDLLTFADGGSAFPGAQVSATTVASPFTTTDNPAEGGSSNATTYDFLWNISGGSFDWSFDHLRSGNDGSHLRSTGSSVRFTVTGTDMFYDISGAYSMVGQQGVNALVLLEDVSTGEDRFDWEQGSFVTSTTSEESFVVGRGGDGSVDRNHGAPSGTLLAGHTYDLSYGFRLTNFFGSTSATAIGDLHFNISNTAPSAPPVVPAPGAALLAIVGLTWVGWLKPGRRDRHTPLSHR